MWCVNPKDANAAFPQYLIPQYLNCADELIYVFFIKYLFLSIEFIASPLGIIYAAFWSEPRA